MSPFLMALVAGIYMYVAASYFRDERAGMGIAFVAYALANLGFIIDMMRH